MHDIGRVSFFCQIPSSDERAAFLNVVTDPDVQWRLNCSNLFRGAISMMGSAVTSTNILSSIANWVCPDCGGRMGGRGKEFKCQGECQKDWREPWEQSHSKEARLRSRNPFGYRRIHIWTR
jgi:tRNA(Ile2) C34 agmatinyltransferase TiaS